MDPQANHDVERTCILCGKPILKGASPFCPDHSELLQDKGQVGPPAEEPTCLRCARPIMGGTPRPFCAVHEAQYQARQAVGVSTAELTRLWCDCLSTWRERPPAAADEPYAARLRFRRAWNGWLFFWMGYPGRLPDWLLVSRATGEVRRFVEVAEREVCDALLGLPVKNQADLSSRWGQPRRTASPFLDQRPRIGTPASAWLRPPLAAVVAGIDVPVYVPASAAAGLVLWDMGLWAGGSGRTPEQSLTFVHRPGPGESAGRTAEELIAIRQQVLRERQAAQALQEGIATSGAWRLAETPDAAVLRYPPLPTQVLKLQYAHEVSYRAEDRAPAEMDARWKAGRDDFARPLFAGLAWSVRAQLTEPVCQALCLQVHSVLWSWAPDRVASIAASPTQANESRLVLDGREFSGTFLYWAATPALCAFRLVQPQGPHVRYRIAGTAYGFAGSDLQAVLAGLVVLNDRPALLAEYQATLTAQFGAGERS